MIEVPSRIPPHDLAAERAVLGAVLYEGASLLPRVAEHLQAPDFYLDAHRIAFEAMLTLGAAGAPIDSITLNEELRRAGQLPAIGGPAAVALMMEQAAIAAHVGAYVDIIRNKATLRGLIQQSTHLLTLAYDDQQGVAELLEEARGRLEGLQARTLTTAAGALFPVRSLRELLAAAIPEPEFHIDKWIRTRGLAFIVGDSEAYKSWFAQYLGMCVAAGEPVLGKLPVRQAPVLYISEENGEVEDKRRAALLCRGMGFAPELPFYIASETSFSFDDAARYAALRAFVAEHGIRVIIIDSFIRVHRREEKDAGAMNSLYMDRMKPVMKDGVDLWLLHHRRKLPSGMQGHGPGQPASDNDDIRGSGDIRAGAFSILFLKTISDSTVVVHHNKARGFKKQEPFVFSVRDTDDGLVLTHEGKPAEVLDKTGACKGAILEYAAAHLSGFFRQDVITALKGKFSKKVIDPALKALAQDAYPLKEDEVQQGRTKKKFYVLVLAEPDAPDHPGGDDDVPF